MKDLGDYHNLYLKLSLSTQEEWWEEELLGNQNANKKHHLEENLKQLDSKKHRLKGCIESYLKA